MTEFEKTQPNKHFIETGRKAYRMNIHVSGNLYKQQPYRDLWEKGWRLERRKEEGQRFPNSRPPATPNSNGKPAFVRKPYPASRPEFSNRPATRQNTPVISEAFVDRFNRRHQTTA